MSDETITIRRLGPADADILQHVADGVFDNAVAPEQTARFLAAPDQLMVVALVQGQVVGMGSAVVHYHPDKTPRFWINEVGTGDAWLRRGIASRVMAELQVIAAERGCNVVRLATEGDNSAARGLYLALGGRETGDLVMYDWGMAE